METPVAETSEYAKLVICPLCNGHFIYSKSINSDNVKHNLHNGSIYTCCRLYRNVKTDAERRQEHLNPYIKMKEGIYTHHSTNRVNDTICPEETTLRFK